MPQPRARVVVSPRGKASRLAVPSCPHRAQGASRTCVGGKMSANTSGRRPPIDAIRRRLEALDQDNVVPESIARHCDNLARLADRLRKLGMDDQAVNAEVLGIFQQYERALVESLLAPKQAG